METATSLIKDKEEEKEKKEQVFCKDCARLLGNRKYLENAESWKCNAEKNRKGVDLLTGVTTLKAPFCREQRTESGNDVCGPEGKWFQLYKYPEELYELPLKQGTSVKTKSTLDRLTLDDL